MSQRTAVDLNKACLLLNHGPATLVSNGRWTFQDDEKRTIHCRGGVHFFATGDGFEV